MKSRVCRFRNKQSKNKLQIFNVSKFIRAVLAKYVYNSELFTRNDIFKVPAGVKSLRVIAVGGGGGGTNGHQSGGAGGHVKCATLDVQPLEEIPVIIGRGGRGAAMQIHNNNIVGCTSGESSSFGGSILVAGGGGACSNSNANAGGTGSGALCWGKPQGCKGGDGGSGGYNGGSSSTGNATGGAGQGHSFLSCLQLAKYEKLMPGAGGVAGNANCNNWGACFGTGGGGGGVLINGNGPSATDGLFPVVYHSTVLSIVYTHEYSKYCTLNYYYHK